MSRPITKEELTAALETQTELLRQSIRDLNKNFTESQASQNAHLAEIDTKLDAIMEIVVTRKAVENLVRELNSQGITIDLRKIIV